MLVWGLDDDLDQSLAATSPLLVFLSLPSLRTVLALLCSAHDGLTCLITSLHLPDSAMWLDEYMDKASRLCGLDLAKLH
jgi:hypothetical protein